MLNKNPAWRYVVVITMLLLTLVYALPNLYPEDPALNISARGGAVISEQTRLQLEQEFIRAGNAAASVQLQDGKIIARFSSAEQQLQAFDQAKNLLGRNYIAALSLMPATPAWLSAIGATPMKLGLDLRGGVHFLLAVDMQAALDKHLNDLVSQFRNDLRQADIRYQSVKANLEQGQIAIVFRQAADVEQAASLLSKQDSQLLMNQDMDSLSLLVSLSEERQRDIRNYALEQNITIMRNRVNEIGVAEPVVQRQGADRIVVQLPGVQDTAQAKEILSATATLEFRLVDTDSDLTAAIAGRLPGNAELYQSNDGRPVLLEKRVLLTGDHITDAISGYDEYSQPKVTIKLDTAGGNLMSDASKSAVGRRMATVFIEYKPGTEQRADGTPVLVKQQEVINDATIQSRLGRDFDITGLSSPAQAQHLASLLRAGALIAPIQVIEERTIGPSLGKENIELGLAAIQWGMLAVLIFMLVYYKAFGLVANIALAANVIFMVGIMSMIPGATLTLPGMAGIVLTVGMAVDANVLIFERIREELAEGRSVQQAIHLGYDRAFATIADSNMTTLLVALILFGVGTGPVKGFAITLAIGIITSIFTAVVGSRLLVNLIWGGRRLQSLPL
ncbi:protein translocase subunit SecD [Arsukibacterium sp. UBA3155]|uniref:protein translocase subunit SecD n=1 Tax=Arsukibacterium sp. UBA3155 TaxID=1946058 RepID=UPI0025C19216|nr:protein translocase subunit SecD [Arsukibacterium sp. UBA3155]|tara:strand:- start:10091 stop:11944 length:1854 start_codon:yes stop_codon:yes gene_type:complete